MRKFLASTALVGSLALAGCATSGSLDANTEAFNDAVSTITAEACDVIPTGATILGIFNQAAGLTAAAVGNAVCSLAPKSSARLMSLPLRASGAAPVQIGTTSAGVPVTVWRAGTVKFERHLR